MNEQDKVYTENIKARLNNYGAAKQPLLNLLEIIDRLEAENVKLVLQNKALIDQIERECRAVPELQAENCKLQGQVRILRECIQTGVEIAADGTKNDLNDWCRQAIEILVETKEKT